MKKRKSSANKKPSNRIPPSIPKCLRKCEGEYTTDYVKQPQSSQTIRFIIRKGENGYAVLKNAANSSECINMANDIRIAPTTRNLFSDTSTLKAAIDAIEEWLGYRLPDIR